MYIYIDIVTGKILNLLMQGYMWSDALAAQASRYNSIIATTGESESCLAKASRIHSK
ncbi:MULTISPECIES: hypothetical protein [Okeania]|uniref:hypothetical protein n=1 Tax=Okeania TaxID=1458928 RepID=UPI00144CB2D0|nr:MULTISPECIES: hypothetical protein [Okeania]NET80253.1 hypothetical protein [Okeania sp. SIO1F9]